MVAKVLVEREVLDVWKVVLFASGVLALILLALYLSGVSPEQSVQSFLERASLLPGAREFLTVNQLLSLGVVQHGGNGSVGYHGLASSNLTNQNITNSTLTGYFCVGSSCNFTVSLDSDNSTRLSGRLNFSDIVLNYVQYVAQDGSLRNVSELGGIGQGSWGVNGSSLNFTLAGGDGFDYGVRDSRPGGSYWLDENGSLYGAVNISNDFIRVGMTERNLTIYNSSNKIIFNASFDDAVRVDNQNLVYLYGSGTQNKTTYFFDWSNQTWKVWMKNASNFTHGVPDWLDPRNKQAFKWKYAFSGDVNSSRPDTNLTFHITAHDPFVRTFVDAQPTTVTVVATGGTITYSGNRQIHTFISNGTFTVTSGRGPVEYLVVGGGGGAAGNSANNWGVGGGGAGGFRNGTLVVTNQSYSIIVGAGGSGGAYETLGTSGSSSTFASITSAGGGRGGAWAGVGLDGGSGGGYGANVLAGYLGNVPSTTPSQGNNGGAGVINGGGGGGGAGSVGTDAGTAPNGGAGLSSSISGSTVWYAGGGGGGGFSGGVGSGGIGGGGAGRAYNGGAGDAGIINTGGGGGGGGSTGGGGGSGIVIISYYSNITHNVTFPFSLPENRTSVTTAEPGLVGYWNFNEGTGLNATDASGNRLSGALIGNVRWVSNSSCRFNGCASFNRGAEYVDLGDPSALRITGDLTIEAWVMPRDFLDNNWVVFKKTTDANCAYQMVASATPYLFLGDGGAGDTVSGGSMSAGNWYHLVGLISGNNMELWLNGARVGTTTYAGTRQSAANIAAFVGGSGGTASNTLIDSIRIYNRALRPDEIAQHYQTGISQQKPGVYFTSNNASSEETLFATTNWRNVNHTGFNVTSNQTNWFKFDYVFNSTQNQNFMLALGTMGRMNTTVFNPANNATAFSSETMESVANSTLTWYDLSGITATGGNVTYSSGYKIHTFTSNGTFNVSGGNLNVEYLVVAGGGGAGGAASGKSGGGGGAGGYRNGTIVLDSSNYLVNVGSGGGGGTGGGSPTAGSDGGSSMFFSITSVGGGGGGYGDDPGGAGRSGGSGGGGGGSGTSGGSGGSGTSGQGNTGGNAHANSGWGGGGGGAGSSGGAGGAGSGGTGGSGLSNSINGSSVTYAAGGGAGTDTAGTSNTGSGGGGNNAQTNGKDGGSGIIIVRYLDTGVTWNVTGPVSGVVQHTLPVSFNYDGGAAGIWRFDEGSGMNATDASGNGAVGTLSNGSMVWIANSSCKLGGCLSFGASVSVDDSKIDFTAPNSGTLEAWVYPYGTPSNPGIMGDYSSNTGFLLWIASGNLATQVQTQGLNSASAVPGNTWSHLVATFDSSKISLYLNGVLVSETARSFGSLTDGGGFNIGAYNTPPTGTTYFRGIIDEPRAYYRALTETEVREHYQREVTKYYDDFGTAAGGKTYRYFGAEDSNTTLQPITPVGTVLHYRFNDNSTANATDSSGSRNDARAVNSPLWVMNSSCRHGNCVHLDGTNDYYQSFNNIVGGARTLTVSFWINPKALQSTGEDRVVSNDYTIFGYNNAGEISTCLEPSAGTCYRARVGENLITTGRWHHVTYVYNGFGASDLDRIKFYYNGLAKPAVIDNPGLIPSSLYNTGSGAGIGADVTATVNSAYNYAAGYVDEVLIVNRTLTADEVYQLYLGGAQRHGGDLVGWWKFNENATQTNYSLDSSGGGNTGSAANGPIWMNNASCRIGGCILLDGSNDRVALDNERNFDFSKASSFSASFWMNQSSQSGDDVIVGKGISASTGKGYYVYTDSLGRLTVRLLSNNSGFDELRYRITGDVTDSLRHHITFTYDGSNTWDGGKIYVDGASETLNNDVGTTSITSDILNDYALTLGSATEGGGENWNGVLDDVKVWKRALTADEVKHEYIQTQDQHSIYGNIHRVTSAEGLQSVSFNLTDHDNPYQTDYDQRSLLFGVSQLDATAPAITVQSPSNTTYSDSSVWANATVSEDVSAVYRSLDSGSNVSMANSTGNWNSNVTGISDGTHTLTFYTTDPSGNVAAPASIVFTVTTSVIVNEVSINRTFNPLVPWWAEYVNISGHATYTNGTPFGSGTIRINETNYGRETTLCSVSPGTSGSFYCNFSSKYQVGDTPISVYAIRAGSIVGNLTGVMETKPNYGERPTGLASRSVLETPFPIQEPSSIIRTIVARLTISRGPPGS